DLAQVRALTVGVDADVVNDVAPVMSGQRHVHDGVEMEVRSDRLSRLGMEELGYAGVPRLALEGAPTAVQERPVGDVDDERRTGAYRIRSRPGGELILVVVAGRDPGAGGELSRPGQVGQVRALRDVLGADVEVDVLF